MANTIFNFRPQKGTVPLYQQLAACLEAEIQQQHLLPGEYLPSIRRLNRDLKISRTTVEAAYQRLIDKGLLESLPSRGYQVVAVSSKESGEKKHTVFSPGNKNIPDVLYNFSNNYVDTATFDTVLWRRCLNRALHAPASITGYGDPQGEQALREVLARYSYVSRGVACQPEQILVGAGLQTLLMILLPLLPVTEKKVGLEAPGFPQAEQIFRLMGWETRQYDPADPNGDWPGLLMISPANPYKGRALTEKERNNLIVATQLERVYLLEDDYNGEFRYLHRPTPALHSFGNRERIIYLGSFSRTMLPSLRISYMVLPVSLLPAYQKIASRYNQTSSTVEQIALATYIGEGHLTRHIKKLRSLYREKSRMLQNALHSICEGEVRLLTSGTGLHLRLLVNRSCSAEMLAKAALMEGVKIIPVRGTDPKRKPEILLSFAGISKEKIAAGVEALHRALHSSALGIHGPIEEKKGCKV